MNNLWLQLLISLALHHECVHSDAAALRRASLFAPRGLFKTGIASLYHKLSMRIRPTVRLLIIDNQERILLLKIEDAVPLDSHRPGMTVYWATPGGGVEAGETFEQAGLRELWEETGMRERELGPCVWYRKRILHFPDEKVLFDERYYLLRVTTPEVVLTNMLPEEQNTYRAHRWWAVEEMETSPEAFVPLGLAALLRPILAGHIPSVPQTLQ